MFIFQRIKDIVTDCIEYASEGHCHKSISFPVIGTDGLGYPPEKVMEWIVEALADWCHSGKQSRIDTVYIVIDDSEHASSEIKLVRDWEPSSAEKIS